MHYSNDMNSAQAVFEQNHQDVANNQRSNLLEQKSEWYEKANIDELGKNNTLLKKSLELQKSANELANKELKKSKSLNVFMAVLASLSLIVGIVSLVLQFF